MIRYEVGEPSFNYFTQTTTVPITMTWPYGETTPPLLRSGQVLRLDSKEYTIGSLTYEPGDEHVVIYTAQPNENDDFLRG